MIGLWAVAALLLAAAPAETVVEAPGAQGALQGTLVEAGQGAPVALIIPGSGPTDRDGNSAIGNVRPASLKLLAEALAAKGIASVRIDKAGMFGSRAAVPDANRVTITSYARDVHSWIKTIRARTDARCVWLIGHSEGSLVALVAAWRSEGVCGVVSLEGAGRPLGQVLREQLQANPANAPVLDQAMEAIAQLEKGKPADTTGMHPALLPLFHPSVQTFLIDQMALDPAKLAGAYKGPLLIVHGTRDIQTTAADAAALAAARPDAKILNVDGMNHVLKIVVSDDRAANIAAYADPGLPLAPGLAAGIAGFVLAR